VPVILIVCLISCFYDSGCSLDRNRSGPTSVFGDGNRWTLPRINYEFHTLFRSRWTRVLVSARWGYGAYSKFSNAHVDEFFGCRFISRNLLPFLSRNLPLPDFYFGGFRSRTNTKQISHRKITTKYWAVHFKRHCRKFSLGCIRPEERVTAWISVEKDRKCIPSRNSQIFLMRSLQGAFRSIKYDLSPWRDFSKFIVSNLRKLATVCVQVQNFKITKNTEFRNLLQFHTKKAENLKRF
jgi:hypothetical protein